MRRAFMILIVAGALIPVLAACAKEPQQQTQQPYQAYPQQQYPQQQYPQQQYPQQQYPPATAAPPATQPPAATQPASPFPFPIPSALPGMIPSGLIPGFPAPTGT